MKRKTAHIELAPVKVNPLIAEKITAVIMKWMKQELFQPLLVELHQPKKPLQNAWISPLALALQTGQVAYKDGQFKGRFNASVSKQLKRLGARWERKTGTFSLPPDQLTPEIKHAIRLSETKFIEQLARIDARLAKFLPETFAGKKRVQDLFETEIFKMDSDFRKNVAKITVVPKFSEGQKKLIASEWTENTERAIKRVSFQRTKSMREEIAKAVKAGKRQKEIGETIVREFGIAERRIKFIARQEVHLALSKFAEVRYRQAGVNGYYWRAVVGTPAHPTRPRHRQLSEMSARGKIFEWANPPNTAEPGQPARFNNPGENFNCRCVAVPVVRMSE